MRKGVLGLFFVLLLATAACAETVLDLDSEFVETLKNRATMIATFSIKFAHSKAKTPSPGKPSNDGDIHISGTAPEIGLITVAEIMNAKDFPTATLNELASRVPPSRAGGDLSALRRGQHDAPCW